MTEYPPPPKPRNPHTQALNRRDTWWQIAVPVGLAVVGALTLMVLAVLPGGAPDRSAWADVSLVFLIIPTAVIGLVLLAALIGLAVGANLITRHSPPYLKQTQDFMFSLAGRTKSVTDRISNVFLSARASQAAAQQAWDGLKSFFSLKRSP